jgi:hypothetical protein
MTTTTPPILRFILSAAAKNPKLVTESKKGKRWSPAISSLLQLQLGSWSRALLKLAFLQKRKLTSYLTQFGWMFAL